MFYSQLLVFTEIFSTYNFKVVLLLLTKTMLKSYLSGDFAGQHQPLLTSIEKKWPGYLLCFAEESHTGLERSEGQ